jgi:hypothetical protein
MGVPDSLEQQRKHVTGGMSAVECACGQLAESTVLI